jgi:hypothetical protein
MHYLVGLALKVAVGVAFVSLKVLKWSVAKRWLVAKRSLV